jgi:16S rRNA (adenine1518-N6/adenine1519-N6)-dimethyltransferase
MIPAKKSLGQNFLKSKEALRALVEAGGVTSEDVILEVGPGKGVLTEELVKLAKKVIAVEKDDRLIELLNEKFKNEIAEGKLEILHQDILEFDPKLLSTTPPRAQPSQNASAGTVGTPPNLGGDGEVRYKIIANIPYYITGTFLQKFLESDVQPSTMVLMVQKEVAQRIATKDPATGQPSGKESILSISVKAYGTPKYIMTVKAKYFSPEPNVDSAIICINGISKDFFTTFSEQKFFEVVKLGFAHKRKMLIGNLSEKYPREQLLDVFAKVGMNEKARAEDLELSQWKQLIELLTN